MRKLLLLTALALLTSLPSLSYDFKTDDGLCYSINNDNTTVYVTYEKDNDPRYSNLSGDITIPESVSYDGIAYKVTSIGGYAFSGCSGLTSVTIGNSVTAINKAAFYECSGLTSVTIGNFVKSIPIDTFYGCSSLTSVNIPNSVTSIGESAFDGCSSLTYIAIPSSITTISRYVFYDCI